MTTDTNTDAPATDAPKPNAEQAERAVQAMLNVPQGRENLVAHITVPDYTAWRARFDAAPQDGAPAGISGTTLFRNIDDDSLLVLVDAAGAEEARQWAHGGWKTTVPEQGQVGAPAFYLGVDADIALATEGPMNVLVRFQLSDYGTWHGLFQYMEASRVSGGVTNSRVFRNIHDGNDVLVLADIAGAQRARDWLIVDQLTGYPAATGVDKGTWRYITELPAGDGSQQ
ncbi:hypothetical protein [Streptomyces sp. CA2R106]|uniref:hypothetical protein n=1 Tax=Streptomyces sp. CA2R106 TaxID=3120153 RepID=UPI00300BF06F